MWLLRCLAPYRSVSEFLRSFKPGYDDFISGVFMSFVFKKQRNDGLIDKKITQTKVHGYLVSSCLSKRAFTSARPFLFYLPLLFTLQRGSFLWSCLLETSDEIILGHLLELNSSPVPIACQTTAPFPIPSLPRPRRHRGCCHFLTTVTS